MSSDPHVTPSTAPPTDYPTALVSPQPAKPAPRAPWWVPCALLIACAVPRIAMAYRLEVICADAVNYIRGAQLVAEGDVANGFAPTAINLFTAVLAGLARLGLNLETAGKIWSVTVATLAVLPIWGWVRQRYDDRVAMAAAFLYIIHPKLIEWSPEILRDPTFWLLAAATVYAGWRAVAEVRVTWFLLAGVAWTLSLFTRFEGWFLLAPLVLWSAWRWWSLESARWRLVAGLAVCLAVCPLTFVALRTTRLRELPDTYWGEIHRLSRVPRWWNEVVGKPEPTVAAAVAISTAAPAKPTLAEPQPTAAPTSAAAVAASSTNVVDQPQADSEVVAPAKPKPTKRPPKLAWTFVHTMRRGLDAVYALLLFGGMWKWRRMWLRRDNQPLFYAALGVVAGVWVHLSLARESSSRYALLIVILGIPFAALGLLGFCDWVAHQVQRFGPRRWASQRLPYAAAYSILILAIGGLGCGDAMHGDEPERRRDAELGRWIAGQLGPGSRTAMVGGLGIVSHYAGAAGPQYHFVRYHESCVPNLESFNPELLLVDRTAVNAEQLKMLTELAKRLKASPLGVDDPGAPPQAAGVLIYSRRAPLHAARPASDGRN